MNTKLNLLRTRFITLLQGRYSYSINRNPSKLEQDTLARLGITIPNNQYYPHTRGLLDHCHRYGYEPNHIIDRIHTIRSEYLFELIATKQKYKEELLNLCFQNRLSDAILIKTHIDWTDAEIGTTLIPQKLLLQVPDPRELLFTTAIDASRYYQALKEYN